MRKKTTDPPSSPAGRSVTEPNTPLESRRAGSGQSGDLARAIARDQAARYARLVVELDRIRAVFVDRVAAWTEAELGIG